MRQVRCQVCEKVQPEAKICSRCGRSLPANPPEVIEVEKIVERVVEKIVEVKKTIRIEQEKVVYVCPHVVCVHCQASDGTLEVKGDSLAEIERAAILNRLMASGGDRLKAAASLGIGRTTMYRKLKEYGINSTRGSESYPAKPNQQKEEAA